MPRKPATTYTLRLTRAEKADLYERALGHNLTLSAALRRGAALYLGALDDARENAGKERRGGRRVPKKVKVAA